MCRERHTEGAVYYGVDMKQATFRVARGDDKSTEFKDYSVEVTEGMVVLDAIHQIQATEAPDLACRWNCKAGKCGSCSAEINGMPKLMCMTRLADLPLELPVIVEPMRAFPRIKDLVTDVSWNYRVKKQIKPFNPRKPDAPDGTWRMNQDDAERVQEFRKCIECFLCQDVCHVLRDHHKHEEFIGPRFLVHAAQLEMHPLDETDRVADLKKVFADATRVVVAKGKKTLEVAEPAADAPHRPPPANQSHGMAGPFIASVMRDVFEVTPPMLKESAYGLGATTWEVVSRVVLPYTRAGVIGGVMLGLGRALGETMAVTFVIGNTNILDNVSLFSPGNSITSALANEFAEAGEGLHQASLIYLGLALFFITFIVLALSKMLLNRLQKNEGART